jgi:transposase
MKLKTTKEFVGIDVSKSKIDAFGHFSNDHQVFLNNKSGFDSLLKWAGSNTSEFVFCFEHCGSYSFALSVYLTERKLPFYQISGMRVKRSAGIKRSKTDKIDSKELARFAYLHREELVCYQLPENDLIGLKGLLSLRRRLTSHLAGHKTFLKEINLGIQLPGDNLIAQTTHESIQLLKQQIRELEKEILNIISSNAELHTTFENIITIKGVGLIVAATMIVYTNNFKNFPTWRKLSCYAGTAPFDNQSGTSLKGKSKVSHLANKILKTLLGQAAATAIQYDAELKRYYLRRLEEGKSKMSTMNIIRNKIVARIFAVAKRGTPFVDIVKFAA